MRKLLIAAGVFFLLIWIVVYQISVGLPHNICAFIDNLTFHTVTGEVFRMQNGFYYDTPNNDMPTAAFLFLFGVSFIVYMWLAVRLPKLSYQKGAFAVIVVFGVLFRLVLLKSEPVHENDFYRYLWDGKQAAHGINPYKLAPDDLFMYENGLTRDHYDEYREVVIKARDFSRADEKNLKTLLRLRDQNPAFFYRIGHRQVPTIYPPVAQLVFLVSAWAAADSVIAMKSVFLLFDVATIFLIAGILAALKRNPAMCLIYAWSPLVLKEIANSGHYDSVVVFLTTLCFYFFFKNKYLSSVVSLTMAGLTKFFSFMLFPFLMRWFRPRHFVLAAVLAVAAYVPFFLWDRTGLGVFAGLNAYNAHWAYNASVFAVIYMFCDTFLPALAESYFPAKMTAGILYLAFLLALYQTAKKGKAHALHQSMWAVAGLFLVNPVGDPWYFCWVVPFLCVFPYRSLLLLSGLLPLSYLSFHSDYGWLEASLWGIPVLNWVIYVPFYLYLGYELKIQKNKGFIKGREVFS